MKQFTVLLKDFINPGKDGLNQKVILDIPEGKTLTESAKEWMKAGYGGSIYVEKHFIPAKQKNFKMVFSTDSDFFLSWPYIPKA